jgi:YcxB-like protein
MRMQLEFSLTPDDYYEYMRAFLTHRRSLVPRAQRGWRSPFALMRAAGLLAIVAMWLIIFLTPDSAAPAPPGAPPPPPATLDQWLRSVCPMLGILFLFIGFVLWFMRSRFLYRRLAPLAMRLGEPRVVEIDDEQIIIREPGCVTQVLWKYFIRFAQTPNAFVLFTAPRLGHILPQRAFPSPEALQEFRAFAQAHIGNQPIGFPVQPPAGTAS